MHTIILNEAKSISKGIDFEKLRNKVVLITGASGIVGLFLLATLKTIQKKYNIQIYTWTNRKVDKNVEPIFEGCQLIQGDICNAKKFMVLPKFDCIFHSAGYGQPAKFLDNKIKTILLNTWSTIKLFELLNPDGSFLFISSSEIYNGLEIDDITENMMGTTNTDHPRSCYIEGKKCGEAICHAYLEKGYNVKIARLCLAYGPGTKIDDKRVINSFIEKGLKNTSIDLLDSGSAIRTYCYITDAVEMLFNILLNGKDTIYNIGGQSKLSILELAQMVGSLLNKEVKIPQEQHSMVGNPKLVNVSCSKYKDEFNKTTFTSLQDGLIKVINWQQRLYK